MLFSIAENSRHSNHLAGIRVCRIDLETLGVQCLEQVFDAGIVLFAVFGVNLYPCLDGIRPGAYECRAREIQSLVVGELLCQAEVWIVDDRITETERFVGLVCPLDRIDSDECAVRTV